MLIRVIRVVHQDGTDIWCKDLKEWEQHGFLPLFAIADPRSLHDKAIGPLEELVGLAGGQIEIDTSEREIYETRQVIPWKKVTMTRDSHEWN